MSVSLNLASMGLLYVVAFLVCLTAIDLGDRSKFLMPKARQLWIACTSAVVGTEIWAQHLIAMLARTGASDASLNWWLTAVVWVVDVLAIYFASLIVRLDKPREVKRAIWAGMIAGTVAAVMPYSGIYAAAPEIFSADGASFWPIAIAFFLGVGGAICIAVIGDALTSLRQKLVCSALLAASTCVMHFIAHASVAASTRLEALSPPNDYNTALVVVGAVVGTTAIVYNSFFSSFVDRHIQATAEHDAAELRGVNMQLAAEIAERIKVEQVLHQHRQALEEEVARRTDSLSVANLELQRVAKDLDAARHRAEAASEAKSLFLANVSHELRTPLNSVLGYAQLLRRDDEFAQHKRLRRYLDNILGCSQQLSRLIGDLLDLSTIEGGRARLSLEPVDLLAAIDRGFAALAPLAAERRITLDRSTADGLPAVQADETRLGQVLANLLANAIKYNRVGGAVVVRAIERDNAVRCEISDTGIGIPAEKQHLVFSPFNRLGAEATAIDGTGIGLTITKYLVEAMGGTIWFISKPDVGSSFFLDLPKAQRRDHAADRGGCKIIEGKFITKVRKRILYIEDNAMNVEVMRDIFEFVDHAELLTSSDPFAGLALAQSAKPDLVVLDINLPGMNGFDLFQQLRRFESTRATPIIALSASATEADKVRGLTAGFAHYFAKPLDIETFLETTRLILLDAGAQGGSSPPAQSPHGNGPRLVPVVAKGGIQEFK
jgi:signal transduction histidine kinase/CheY-like chemotaxis protein